MKALHIFLSALFLFAASHAYPLTGDEAVAKFRQRMLNPGKVTGTISWTTLGGQTYSGNFKYMSPNKLYIKFVYPEGKILVTNGKQLWVYNPSSNICGVQDLAEGTSSGGIANIVVGYQAIASVGGSGYTIKLKNEGKKYSEITLVVDKTFFLKSAIFRTQAGQAFTVSISNIDRKAKVDPEMFNFKIPAKAQKMKNPLNLQ